MKEASQDNFESAYSNTVFAEGDLYSCIKGLPMLVFRVEVVKKRIEYLNEYQIEGLAERTFLLLKDRAYSREIIFEQDYYMYESFIQAILDSKPAIAVIRVKTGESNFRWIKLTGVLNSFQPGYYMGMIVDISQSITIIEEMNRNEDEQQTILELVGNPVFLVSMNNKSIISHNAAACEIFGYGFDEFRKLTLNNLIHPRTRNEMDRIYEEIIFEKRWEGKILFVRKGGTQFLGTASLRSLKIREKRLLRMSIYECDMVEKGSAKNQKQYNLILSESRKKYLKGIMDKLATTTDLKMMLEILLYNPYKNLKYDVIMYSDVQVRKGIVTVYGVGEALNSMKFGEVFSYEGTIAENIEQYKLDYLIVEDTIASIKAIDWALFIPNGIRSYYARPFYERDILRSVLILCSREANAFKEERLSEYQLLDAPFNALLKSWRKAFRIRKKA
ncbi:MAG: PAS domain S-box protein [Bacteroidales bacterium]